MIEYVAGACPAERFSVYFLVCETQKGDGACAFSLAFLASCLNRSSGASSTTIVERHAGDAYVKSFTSWDHLVALVYAQLRGVTACAAWKRAGTPTASTITIWAAARWCARPCRMPTAATGRRLCRDLRLVAGQLDRQTRREGTAMVRLIDSTPIPLGKLCDWAKSNGRIRGMKMHVVYDPEGRLSDASSTSPMPTSTTPRSAARSPSRPARPMSLTRAIAITAGGPAIAAAGAVFVTRPKTNMALELLRERPVAPPGRRLHRARGCRGQACQQGRFQAADPAAPPHRPAPGRRHHHPADQRSRAIRRRNRRPLQGPLADRAAVPLDQAASQDPQASSATTTMPSACSSSPR